jgi:DNA-binding CsgD family transcriptional regulator
MADQTGPTAANPIPPLLIGREREQGTLHAAFAAALAGHGSLVLIGGEAGIGKTALAEWLLAAAAQQGALVLVGRCYDLSETPPYGPWLEVVARYPATPDLPPLPAVVTDRAALNAIAGQAALFAQVLAWFAAVAAARPLVLLLDDLQWADPASLDLLRVLARNLAERPILVLAPYRADEVAGAHPLAALLPRLVRESRATRLDVHPLDAGAIATLVAVRCTLPEAEHARLVGYLAARTEGNALFLGEVLRTLEDEGLLRRDGDRWALGDLERAPVPALLRHVIAGRVARLVPEAARLLAVAAVIGQAVPLALWAAVAETDEEGLLDAIDAAGEAHLIAVAPGGDAVSFAHALIREALYEGLVATRRRLVHRRVAEALVTTAGPDPDAVAYHFRQAGDGRAVTWLVRAGERAERTYAWLTAAARLEAALALLVGADARADERGYLLLHLAQLCRYADPLASVAHADEAFRLATAAGDRGLAATVLAERGLFRIFALDLRRGLEELAAGVAAEEAVARDGPAGGRYPVPARGTLILNLVNAGRLAEAAVMGKAYLVGAVHATQAGDGWLGLGMARALLGQPAEAARAFARARAAYREVGHHAMLASTGMRELALFALTYAPDRVAERRRLAAEAEGDAARAGGAGIEAPARAAALPLLMLEGHWAEARELGLVAHRSGRRTYHMLAARLTLGPLARALGEADLAWDVVQALLPEGPAARPGEAIYHDAVAAQRLAAALALDAGDLPAARAWLDAHDRWLGWSGAVLGRAEGQLGWATYHRAGGDLPAARAHAEAALAAATTPRQPLALLAAHRALGEIATDDQRAEARTHLDRALALAEACAAPYERALTLLALAELRASAGERAASHDALAEARAILAPLGAAPALARADALAARLAESPAAQAAAALPFGLTAREAEVLRLIATGLTDAQIAAQLFISRYTVNGHTKVIYGKLGVTSRAAATRRALEHDLR